MIKWLKKNQLYYDFLYIDKQKATTYILYVIHPRTHFNKYYTFQLLRDLLIKYGILINHSINKT